MGKSSAQSEENAFHFAAQEKSWTGDAASSSDVWMPEALGSTHTLSAHEKHDLKHNKERVANKDKLRARRCKLEYDVIILQSKLEDELELRSAYEKGHQSAIRALANLPSHVPAQKLVLDVAMLEFAVSKLEEQIAQLQWQIVHERSEREAFFQDSSSLFNHGEGVYVPLSQSPEPKSPDLRLRLDAATEPASPDNVLHGHREKVFMSSSSSTELPNSVTDSRHRDSIISDAGLTEAEERLKAQILDEDAEETSDAIHKADSTLSRDSFLPPENQGASRLSEQMVRCMMDIYQHLSEPGARRLLSPVGASSFLSFARSPLVDLRSHGRPSFDPFAAQDRLCWLEPGPYSKAVEVCSLSVGKDELEYAAEALQRFKNLVERLSVMNPGTMSHSEKLAFWINVYNALMMHAYLAYGTPKNESKCYALMQKANYTIGGYPVNAMLIQQNFLKGRPVAHWKASLGRLKAADERQRSFALTRSEPLVAFALSFGARSCPAVRVYTAEAVEEQLQSALNDYVQASVGVSNRGKLLVPRLVYSHARDLSSDATCVWEWIFKRLSKSQQDFARSLLHHTPSASKSRSISIVPFDSRFRYLFLPIAVEVGAAPAA